MSGRCDEVRSRNPLRGVGVGQEKIMGQRGNLVAGYVYFTRVFLGLVIKVLSLRSPHISIDCFKRHQVHARLLQRKQSMQLNIVMPTVEYSLGTAG